MEGQTGPDLDPTRRFHEVPIQVFLGGKISFVLKWIFGKCRDNELLYFEDFFGVIFSNRNVGCRMRFLLQPDLIKPVWLMVMALNQEVRRQLRAGLLALEPLKRATGWSFATRLHQILIQISIQILIDKY